MRDWRALLAQKKLLVADGAWGTQLVARGLPAGQAPETWNLERPDEVRAVAAAYVQAGADIILTNTFGGSRLKLAKEGLDADLEEVNRRGAELSREAAGDKALVFASVGPTGEFMAPLGTVTEDEMTACFAEQVKALAAGGADAVVIETMTDLLEAIAALRAVKDTTSLPAVVCLTYDKGAKGFATMMGVRPEQAAPDLAEAGADVIGTNCGNGIEDIVEVVKLLRAAAEGPLWAKPNAGLPELVGGQTVYRETPEQMVRHLPTLVEAGAAIVGGCCGTTPEHIRLLALERQNLLESAAG
jgi:5-methyltetrahydrofolate--homocysteine methyltransferase